MGDKVITLFSKPHLFRSHRTALRRSLKEQIRAWVLLNPRGTVASLKDALISANRLRPIKGLALQGVLQAVRKPLADAESTEGLSYEHIAVFSFRGSPALWQARDSTVPSFMGQATVSQGSLTRTYSSVSNDPADLTRSAELALFHLRFHLEGQERKVASFNEFAEAAIDDALHLLADHIALWRLEGELNLRPLRAMCSVGRNSTSAVEANAQA